MPETALRTANAALGHQLLPTLEFVHPASVPEIQQKRLVTQNGGDISSAIFFVSSLKHFAGRRADFSSKQTRRAALNSFDVACLPLLQKAASGSKAEVRHTIEGDKVLGAFFKRKA